MNTSQEKSQGAKYNLSVKDTLHGKLEFFVIDEVMTDTFRLKYIWLIPLYHAKHYLF